MRTSRKNSLKKSETRKQIHMLNSGTNDLEKILSVRRVGKSNFGLGYKGVQNYSKTEFVRTKT